MLFKKSKQHPEEYPEWFIRLSEKEKEIALRVSLWLQDKTARISATRLKIWLAIFFILMTTVYGTIGWLAFQGKSRLQIDYPQPLAIPHAKPAKSKVTRIHKKPAVDHYLDSLLSDSAGRKGYDSLLQTRPGLVDSILKINLNPY